MFEFCFDLELEKCVQDFFQTLPVNSHVIQFLRRKNSITETKIIPTESTSVKLLVLGIHLVFLLLVKYWTSFLV